MAKQPPASSTTLLESLSAAGLVKPPGWTLRRFLTHLAQEGLLTEGGVTGYLTTYEAARFGVERAGEAQSQAIEGLEEEIQRLAESASPALQVVMDHLETEAKKAIETGELERRSVTRHGTGSSASCQKIDRAEEGVEHDLAPLATEGDAEAYEVYPPDFEEHDDEAKVRSRHFYVLRGALVVLICSLLAAAAGYWWSTEIDEYLGGIRYEEEQQLETLCNPSQDMLAFRSHLLDTGTRRIEFWLRYAQGAAWEGCDAEAVVAYHRIIAQQPDDPRALNNLAWLLLTTDDRFVRDGIQALPLAERAYALDQAPHITDTLAEAVCQNGDHERAVQLSQDALARTTENHGFYEARLERFRQARDAGYCDAVQVQK